MPAIVLCVAGTHRITAQTRAVPIATEVELKLAAQPDDLPELKRTLLAMTSGAVSPQERLLSTYYDTHGAEAKRTDLARPRARRTGDPNG
jgi:inorganic triphosphatase YgiF